jgi:hypothetical protein
METLIGGIEHGMSLDRAQFCQALDLARKLGHGFDASLARLALRIFPGDPDFLGFAQAGALFAPLSLSAVPAPKVPADRFGARLLARLGLARSLSA